jgi:NADPH:quinone reductase
MHAIEIERHGAAEVLEYKEVPDPVPGEGQALVDVEAIGVNFRDVYEREARGAYAGEVPRIIGAEGAGRVHDTGEHVAWISAQGGYADRVAVSRDQLLPVPEGVSSEVAAAALLQGMTAHFLANDSYPIEDGDWVIVHAAAGGVGLLLTQIAKLRGGRVIATTSTEEKASLAREAGADEVLAYDGFASRAREITGGEGVAAVYDGVGKTTFLEGLDAIRPTGRMILYGAASGQPDPLDMAQLMSHGSLYAQRPTLVTYARTPELLRQRAAAVFDLLAAGKLSVRIGHRYPLSEVRAAHEDLEGRKTTGKILLLPE